jgi:hypothetical protein
MKLNMIVVMTTWLPRRACSQAGPNAHPAPKAAATRTAAGTTSTVGHAPAPRHSRATPSPAMEAWPSAPMLNRPPWKATATARPVNTKLVA